jgi:hypothetical protein
LKTIPLFGTGIRSISDIVTRQRRVNCFYHLREDQDRAAIVIHGTPGLSVFATIPESPIYGMRVVGNLLYVVAGTSLYAVSTIGSVTHLGGPSAKMPTVSRYVGMSDNGFHLMIVDGIAGYLFTFATGVLSKIVDANFPNGCISVDFLDGRFYVDNPVASALTPTQRQFNASSLVSGIGAETWPGLAFGTKENSSDSLVRVSVLNGALVLWGTTSIEFWQDVGTVPLPVQRINGATQSWGLAAFYSLQYLGNTAVFLGTNRGNGVQVIKLKGYNPERISTADIEDVLSNIGYWADITSLTYMVDGHLMYQFTSPTANRSFLYDDNTGVWSETQTGAGDTPARHMGNLSVAFFQKNYVTDLTSGNIYLVDDEVFTDNGITIPRQVATKHIRNQGNEVSMSELMLDFETGVGNAASPNPKVALRLSKDSGATFGPEKWFTLGAIGKPNTRVIARRLGSARDFVVQITVTDPVKFVIASGSAEIELSED